MKLGLNTMRAAVNFGLWGAGVQPTVDAVQLAESLGYDSVWTSEASGTDAVGPLAWLAARTSRIKIGTATLQMTARTPAMTAMTAATLDHLSRGRFILGLGVSGPAVVEGWHGEAYGRPLARTREYVEIVRRILARNGPMEFHGEYYDLPYTGTDGTGVAEAIKLMFRPRRLGLPIFLAAMGPANLRLAYEIADGVIPAFYSPFREAKFFEGLPADIRSRRVELAPFVPVVQGPDVEACWDQMKHILAFWLGAMGAHDGPNYYNNLLARLGYEGVAQDVKRLYAAGKRSLAAAAVPNAMCDELGLCGPRERIAERLAAWKSSSVTTMILTNTTTEAVRTMAELVL